MQARGFTLFAKENDSKLFFKKTEVSTYCFSSLLPAYGFILKKLHCTNWATCAYGGLFAAWCTLHTVHIFGGSERYHLTHLASLFLFFLSFDFYVLLI